MAHPHRDADAAVVHARCLPAAGKLTRVGRREQSLSARMGSRYAARLLMTPAARIGYSIVDRLSTDRGNERPAMGKRAMTISTAPERGCCASAILRAQP